MSVYDESDSDVVSHTGFEHIIFYVLSTALDSTSISEEMRAGILKELRWQVQMLEHSDYEITITFDSVESHILDVISISLDAASISEDCQVTILDSCGNQARVFIHGDNESND